MENIKLTEMLYKLNLLDDPSTTKEYLEIINDYMLKNSTVWKILSKASGIKKNNPGFNHYEYIVYGLVKNGKQ
ncbi:MAG: hypothetical protein IKS54_06415 [Erysipelotrichaceae bacterium]|nr:hypothetical protein [Erysipelotrichaceae bacterium]